MRVIATIHDERIPVGTLCDLAEAVRSLADDGRIWCAVVDGRISVVTEGQAATVATPPTPQLAPVAAGDDYHADFRSAWEDNDGVIERVAKDLGEPVHVVIRTARRLGLRSASSASGGAADGVA